MSWFVKNDRYLIKSTFIIKIVAITAIDYKKFFNKLKKTFIIKQKLINRLSKFFKNKTDCFDYKKVNKLLFYRKNDYKIQLVLKITFSTKKIYEMFKNQANVIKKYINKILTKDYI